MKNKLIALVGSPNSGKTSLFNALTGSHQKVGNYPGVTVEKKIGEFEGHDIVDLPGLYSFDTRTLDERISKRVVLGKSKNLPAPDLLVVVVDATNLKRSLYLARELKELGRPMIIALNLFDLALKRGLELDLSYLADFFNCPVVPTSSVAKGGVDGLKKSISREIEKDAGISEIDDKSWLKNLRDLGFIQKAFGDIDRILAKSTKKNISPDSFTERLDRVVLHPLWGSVLMLTTLVLMFELVFEWAGPLTEMIEDSFSWLAVQVNGIIPEESLWNSFVNDGILAGIGGVLVFLPQIILLFFVIMVFEDFGYLGRMAFLLDHFFRRLGLPGKSVVPLLSSHACAVPGMMAARTIENENDRLATMLVAPLTTCSARIPVYTLLIAAFIPAQKVFGPIGLQALVMLSLYMLGIISSFIMAFILKKTILTGTPSRLLMELPGYKTPRLSYVLRGLWIRTKLFLQKVGKVIVVLTIIVWALISFPRQENGVPDLENSYAARVGKTLSPIFKPLGFDWKLTTALIPSFGAREIVVASLATVLAVEGEEDDEGFETKLATRVKTEYSLATILSLIIWFVFAPQCLSTFAILKKESDSWGWTVFMGLYTTGLAYFGSLIVYQIFS